MTRQVLVDRNAIERALAFLTYRNYCSYCGEPTRGILSPDQKHLDNCPAPAFYAALTQPPAEPERALEAELEILRRGWERDAIAIYAQETVKEADGSTTWLDNECRTEHDTLHRCIAELLALTQPPHIQ